MALNALWQFSNYCIIEFQGTVLCEKQSGFVYFQIYCDQLGMLGAFVDDNW